MPGYQLKLNSYDLGVDIELADAIQRLRFEHPEVRTLVIASLRRTACSARARTSTCSASRTHAFKVNFCKFTNETRLCLEELSRESRRTDALRAERHGVGRRLRAGARLRGDPARRRRQRRPSRSPRCRCSACSPGPAASPASSTSARSAATSPTSSRRSPRASRASARCEWGLVDEVVPRSRFEAPGRGASGRARGGRATGRGGAGGIALPPLDRRDASRTIASTTRTSRSRSTARAARRRARRARADRSRQPSDPGRCSCEAGADAWALRAFRELDDAVLHLRFNQPEIGLVLAADRGGDSGGRARGRRALAAHREDWFVREILLLHAARAEAARRHRAQLLRADRAGRRLRRARSSSWRSPPTARTCSSRRPGAGRSGDRCSRR